MVDIIILNGGFMYRWLTSCRLWLFGMYVTSLIIITIMCCSRHQDGCMITKLFYMCKKLASYGTCRVVKYQSLCCTLPEGAAIAAYAPSPYQSRWVGVWDPHYVVVQGASWERSTCRSPPHSSLGLLLRYRCGIHYMLWGVGYCSYPKL